MLVLAPPIVKREPKDKKQQGLLKRAVPPESCAEVCKIKSRRLYSMEDVECYIYIYIYGGLPKCLCLNVAEMVCSFGPRLISKRKVLVGSTVPSTYEI